MFLHLCVILFTEGEGVSLTETSLDRDLPGQRPLWTETPVDRDTPLDRDTLSTGTPPAQRPPWTETPYGKEWAVRILLECILVLDIFNSVNQINAAR